MSNVVAAFTEEHTQRLTGLTRRQLRHWDRTRFFSPSYADENRGCPFSRIYSFRDIAALRVLSKLRSEGVSLQHLRKVSKKLSHLDEDKWTGTTLYVLNKKVVFHEPETGKPREVVSGQYTLSIPLKIVVSETRKAVARLRERPMESRGRVSRDKWIAHNAWVVSGTRIPVQAIRNFHDAGYSNEQIIREYPDITVEDIRAALKQAAKIIAA